MGKTFTEQGTPPSSNIDADGDGMHTLIPYDFVRGLNNLGTYVNPHIHYAQSGSYNLSTGASGLITVTYVGASSERYLLQIPVIIPFWAIRMAWVVGARGMGATTLNTITTYLSKTPYTGPDGNDGAFNAAGMTTGYLSRAVSMSTLTGGAYELADDSSTGITPISGSLYQLIDSNGESKTMALGYAIVTGTGGASATIELDDFTCWFLPS
jgi:hypothetical protein